MDKERDTHFDENKSFIYSMHGSCRADYINAVEGAENLFNQIFINDKINQTLPKSEQFLKVIELMLKLKELADYNDCLKNLIIWFSQMKKDEDYVFIIIETNIFFAQIISEFEIFEMVVGGYEYLLPKRQVRIIDKFDKTNLPQNFSQIEHRFSSRKTLERIANTTHVDVVKSIFNI